MKKENGFALIEVLLIVLILAVVGFGGYKVYKNEQNKKKPATSSSTTSKTQAQSSATTTDPYAGWKAYSSQYVSFSFKYPSDWTVKNDSNNVAASKSQESIEIDSPTTAGYYFALQFSRAAANEVEQNFLGKGPCELISTLPGKYNNQTLLLVAPGIRNQVTGLTIATTNDISGCSMGLLDPSGLSGVNNVTFSANLIAQGSSSSVNQTLNLDTYQKNSQYENVVKVFQSINK